MQFHLFFIISRFAEGTNAFSNWIIIFQFFTSAVSIGITMFQLTVVLLFKKKIVFVVALRIPEFLPQSGVKFLKSLKKFDQMKN